MTNARSFHLGDILSITTERLVSPDHMGGIYRILNHMTGDDLMTHQLPRAADECKPELLRQHPDLANITSPAKFNDQAHLWRWLAEQTDRYGMHRDVTPMPDVDHTRINPIAEILMMRPDAEIVTLDEGGDR